MAEIENFDLENQKNSETVKCENCGSNMIFDPLTQTLKCEYCGTFVDFTKDANVKELEIQQGFENGESWQNETNSYRCENCGAKVVVAKIAIRPKRTPNTICFILYGILEKAVFLSSI